MKLAVCAICRNEAPYLIEWIAFQRAVGFDKVFIYDNVSDDGTSEMLAALHEAGIVERRHWPRRLDVAPQREAYANFIETSALAFDWVLVYDLDEFLVPHSGDVRDFINAAVAAKPDVSAIAVPWLVFGSGGETKKRDGLVMERFTRCAETPAASVKTLFRPACAYNMRTHICDLTVGEYIDNAFRVAEWSTDIPIDLRDPKFGHAVVNHYFTKSQEEWAKRRRIPKADRAVVQTKSMKFFNRYREQTGESRAVLRFLPAVRQQFAAIEEALSTASQLEAANFTLHVVSTEWIIGETHNVPPDSRIRVVVNDHHEVTTTNGRILESGGCGFIVNVRWLNEPVTSIRVSVLGGLIGKTFPRERFPSRRRMLRSATQHFPSAEQIIFNLASGLCATREGVEIVRSLPLPPFIKFREFGDLLDAILSIGEDQDAWLSFLVGYREKHGKAGEAAIARFIKDGNYVGGLILGSILSAPETD